MQTFTAEKLHLIISPAAGAPDPKHSGQEKLDQRADIYFSLFEICRLI